ncbi:MAG TPA: right-handed parallel beta-helix repeat-containing protein [Kofleriaceae bacterium]|jgi:hypothetical protein
MFMLVLSAGAACSKANPNRCCVDEADCTANDIPQGSTCSDGLVCRGNQCIAEVCTTTAECDPAAPYCASGGLCSSTCDDNSQCPGFGQDASDKICSNRTCLQCVAASDCPTQQPVCDNNSCRACAMDSECASGACADDGSCVDTSAVIYIDAAQGLDAGRCTQSAPCKSLQFAVSSALPTRSHIVMAPGLYVGSTQINSMVTQAPVVTVHGHGASIESAAGSDNNAITVDDVAATLEDLDFPGGDAMFATSIVSLTAPCNVYRVTIEDTGGIGAGANMTIEDVTITNTNVGDAIDVGLGSHLSLDRGVINAGQNGGLVATNGGVVAITNLLVFGTIGPGIDLAAATGSVAFTTVADTGLGGSTPRAFDCSAGLSVTSSIIWTPLGPPIGGGCSLNSDIAGPTPVLGTTNQDPMFVDEAHRNYHISASSPAKDQVDTGPANDFEGDPRPQGARYDIGADEAPP